MTTTTRRIALGIGASLLALGISAGVYASAQNTSQPPPPFSGAGPGGRGPMGRGGPGGPMGLGDPLAMIRMLGSRIGLTDAQKDQIKGIVDSRRDELKALGDRARTAHEALREAVMADVVNESLIRQRSADAAAVDADMAVAHARVYAEVFQLLTADQKAQVKAFQGEMKERMKERAQGRGRGLF